MSELPELWGLHDIALALGISDTAAQTRRHRGQLPTPAGEIGSRPFWVAEVIRAWIEERKKKP